QVPGRSRAPDLLGQGEHLVELVLGVLVERPVAGALVLVAVVALRLHPLVLRRLLELLHLGLGRLDAAPLTSLDNAGGALGRGGALVRRAARGREQASRERPGEHPNIEVSGLFSPSIWPVLRGGQPLPHRPASGTTPFPRGRTSPL